MQSIYRVIKTIFLKVSCTSVFIDKINIAAHVATIKNKNEGIKEKRKRSKKQKRDEIRKGNTKNTYKTMNLNKIQI
jgi:hypothetical protein